MASTSAGKDLTGSTWLCDLPCPDCGEHRVVGVALTDEVGRHQHTRYICTFWRSGVKPDLSGALHPPCGWQGWTVPGWDAPRL